MTEVAIDARIECVDGPCGQCLTLIVDRATRKVTQLVLEDETLPHKPYQRLVPVNQVVAADKMLIRLSCTRDEVARMEPFIQTHYIRKTELGYSVLPVGEGPPADASTGSVSYSTYEEERIPEGAVAIRPGIDVEATDGHAGTVGELVVDPQTAEITHFVLREGLRWGRKEVTLPLAAIDRVAGDTAYLKLDRQAIGQLPAIPVRRLHIRRGDEASEVEAKVELVAVAFDGLEDAGQALEHIDQFRKKGTLKILNAAVLVKDADGKVIVKDTRDIGPKKGRLLGAVTGGLIGLVGGPAGAVVGALAGAGAGGMAGKHVDFGFSDKFLAGLQEHLRPDTSALIVVVEHEYYDQLSEIIAEEEGVFFRQALTDKLVEALLAEPEQDDA
ncbi:MAG: DUF1269 domain-containing protein [Anaerolineae bacterium]|jgi:uncharacterized membrane protein